MPNVKTFGDLPNFCMIESGLQARPPLSILFSVSCLFLGRCLRVTVTKLCPVFQAFSVLHQPTHPLPKLSNKRRVMLLDRLDGVPEQFGHIVRAATTRQHVHRESIAVPVRV